MRVFETRTATGSGCFPFYLVFTQPHLHCQVSFLIRDDKYKNLGDTTVLAREMFSFGCRPSLKNTRA